MRRTACSCGIKQAGRQAGHLGTAASRDIAPPPASIAPAVTPLPARNPIAGAETDRRFDALPGLDDDSEDPDRTGGGCSRRRAIDSPHCTATGKRVDMKIPRIVVVGSVNADMVVKSQRLPGAGRNRDRRPVCHGARGQRSQSSGRRPPPGSRSDAGSQGGTGSVWATKRSRIIAARGSAPT